MALKDSASSWLTNLPAESTNLPAESRMCGCSRSLASTTTSPPSSSFSIWRTNEPRLRRAACSSRTSMGIPPRDPRRRNPPRSARPLRSSQLNLTPSSLALPLQPWAPRRRMIALLRLPQQAFSCHRGLLRPQEALRGSRAAARKRRPRRPRRPRGATLEQQQLPAEPSSQRCPAHERQPPCRDS